MTLDPAPIYFVVECYFLQLTTCVVYPPTQLAAGVSSQRAQRVELGIAQLEG